MHNRYIRFFLTLILLGCWLTSTGSPLFVPSSESDPIFLSHLSSENSGFETRAATFQSLGTNPTSPLTPWYTSTWAYAGYTLLTMLLLYGTWLAIIHRDRRRHHRLSRHKELVTLRTANQTLRRELELRDAEIFSQNSLLLAKNEMIARMRDLVGEFTHQQGHKSLMPLYYKINTIIGESLDTEGDWKLFLIRFEQTNAGFFRTLKSRYPDLTCSDLRLCACLKLRLDSKQIAALMNLSLRAVENSRYRLRKKLELDSAENLNDFLLNITPDNSASEENTFRIDLSSNSYQSAS